MCSLHFAVVCALPWSETEIEPIHAGSISQNPGPREPEKTKGFWGARNAAHFSAGGQMLRSAHKAKKKNPHTNQEMTKILI
jgi:hypothetical protein